MESSNRGACASEPPLMVDNWPLSPEAVREHLKKIQIRLEQYQAALRLAGVEIERRNRSLSALTAFTYQASRVTSPGILLKLALVQALQTIGAVMGAVVVIEPASTSLLLGVHKGVTPELADILTGRQLSSGAMALMPHLSAGSGALLERATSEDEAELLLLGVSNLTSLVSLPIQIGNKLTGALLVGLQGERCFKSAELCYLMALSQATADALEALQLRQGLWRTVENLLTNETRATELEALDSTELDFSVATPFQLPPTSSAMPQPSSDDLEQLLAAMMAAEEEVQQQHNDLQKLNTIAELLNRTLELKEILTCAVEQTHAVLEIDAAWIYLFNANGQLELSAQIGLSKTYVRGMRLLILGEGMEGQVAYENVPQFIDQVAALDSRTHKIWVDKEQLHALAAVPISRPSTKLQSAPNSTQVVGVLGVGKHTQTARPWSPREMRLLTSIASHVALAIDNAHLYAQIQEDHVSLSAGNDILREINELLLRKNAVLTSFIEEDLMEMLVTAKQHMHHLGKEGLELSTGQKENMRNLYRVINRMHAMAHRIVNSS
jgi:GAF domain-containing protein